MWNLLEAATLGFYHQMMKKQPYILAAVVFMLMGCGNGHNGHGTNEAYLPQPEGPTVAAVTTGEPGDRWLDIGVSVAFTRRSNKV